MYPRSIIATSIIGSFHLLFNCFNFLKSAERDRPILYFQDFTGIMHDLIHHCSGSSCKYMYVKEIQGDFKLHFDLIK